MKAHRKLKTWNLGCSLVDRIYDLTAEFPAAEKFNLTSQLRRAAVSIPSNIAEGNGRHTTKDYLSFLYRARGSVRELDTQLTISENQGYLESPEYQSVSEELETLSAHLQAQITSLENTL